MFRHDDVRPQVELVRVSRSFNRFDEPRPGAVLGREGAAAKSRERQGVRVTPLVNSLARFELGSTIHWSTLPVL